MLCGRHSAVTNIDKLFINFLALVIYSAAIYWPVPAWRANFHPSRVRKSTRKQFGHNWQHAKDIEPPQPVRRARRHCGYTSAGPTVDRGDNLGLGDPHAGVFRRRGEGRRGRPRRTPRG